MIKKSDESIEDFGKLFRAGIEMGVPAKIGCRCNVVGIVVKISRRDAIGVFKDLIDFFLRLHITGFETVNASGDQVPKAVLPDDLIQMESGCIGKINKAQPVRKFTDHLPHSGNIITDNRIPIFEKFCIGKLMTGCRLKMIQPEIAGNFTFFQKIGNGLKFGRGGIIES